MKSNLIYPKRKVVTATEINSEQYISQKLTHQESRFVLDLDCGHRESRPKTAANPLPPRTVRCHACDPVHKPEAAANRKSASPLVPGEIEKPTAEELTEMRDEANAIEQGRKPRRRRA